MIDIIEQIYDIAKQSKFSEDSNGNFDDGLLQRIERLCEDAIIDCKVEKRVLNSDSLRIIRGSVKYD